MKSPKRSFLEDMKNKLKAKGTEGLDKHPGLKKVVVASPTEKGLEKGLSFAEQLLAKRKDMFKPKEDDKPLSEVLPESEKEESEEEENESSEMSSEEPSQELSEIIEKIPSMSKPDLEKILDKIKECMNSTSDGE